MFDLNEQLHAWRQCFADAEALKSADFQELEHHVRDAVADLAAKGLTQEEAFAIAIRRVGDPRPLVAEFKKVNGNHIWAQRAFWMIVGFLTLQILSMVVKAATGVGQLLAAYAGAGTMALKVAWIAAPAACWLAIIFGFCRSSSDPRGGPLAKIASIRRWQLIALTAIVPIAAEFVQTASYLYLSTVPTRNDFVSVAEYRYWSAPFISFALFLLLFAAADFLRRSAPEATA